MPLSVGAALRDGLGRTFERNGLQLVAAVFVLRLATSVADDTLRRANRELAGQVGELPGGGAVDLLGGPTPYALGVGVPAAFLLVVLVALLAEAVRIVAVRTLVSDRVDAVPAEYVRRNIGTATLNGFAGGVVVLTLTAIGLVLLVVPGVFLALSLFFVRQEIAVRDVNFVEAMSGSWELSAGHRLELLALAAALVLVELVVALPAALVAAVDPAVATFVGAALQAVVVVFGIASTCRAYDQLRSEPAAAADEFEGPLGPDDLPEPGRDGGW